MINTGLESFNPSANYCTATPDWVATTAIRECCYYHDLAYEMQLPRLAADEALESCILQSGSGLWVVIIAVLMSAAVRAFGWKFYRKK